LTGFLFGKVGIRTGRSKYWAERNKRATIKASWRSFECYPVQGAERRGNPVRPTIRFVVSFHYVQT